MILQFHLLFLISCTFFSIEASTNTFIFCQQPFCSSLLHFRQSYLLACSYQNDKDSVNLKALYEHILNENAATRMVSCDPDYETCSSDSVRTAKMELQHKDPTVVLAGTTDWMSSIFNYFLTWTSYFQSRRFYFITNEEEDDGFRYNLQSFFMKRITFSLILLKQTSFSIHSLRNKSTKCFQDFGLKIWETSFDQHKIAGKFYNYRNARFRCAGVPNFPFYFENNEGTIDGIDIRVMNAIAKTLNFQYDMVMPSDRKWGAKTKNGSWNGKIGLVHRNQADFAMSAISVSHSRAQAIDYSVPYYWSGLFFVSPMPEFLPEWQVIILPFPWNVWLLIFASLVVSFLCISFTTDISAKLNGTPLPINRVTKALMFTIRFICHSSCPKLPKNHATRVITIFWAYGCFIILVVYSGILTSFFTSPVRENPIRTIQDLVSAENMKWGKVNFGGAYDKFFSESKNPNLKYLWERMVFTKDLSECVDKTMKERFSCFNGVPGLQAMGKRNEGPGGQIPFTLSTEKVLLDLLAYPTRKNTTFRESFDPVIQRLFETGIIKKWTEEFTLVEEKLRASKRVSIEGNVVLSLSHFTGPFYVLLFGLGLALIGFAVENIVHRVAR